MAVFLYSLGMLPRQCYSKLLNCWIVHDIQKTICSFVLLICLLKLLSSGELSSSYLLGRGGYVFGSVGFFVCKQHYSKSYERIVMKLYGGVWVGKMNKWLNFGGDLGLLRWVNVQKTP